MAVIWAKTNLTMFKGWLKKKWKLFSRKIDKYDSQPQTYQEIEFSLKNKTKNSKDAAWNVYLCAAFSC